MTTIILVAIGVLIAAAAALFVIFYGGTAFGESKTKAEAARLVSEGQQISYATEMYYRQEDKLPGTKADGTLDGVQALADLKAKNYLPIPPVGSQLTNVDGWKMEYGTDGMIYSKLGAVAGSGATSDQVAEAEAAMDVCRQARIQLSYTTALDKDADGKTRVFKCDGSDYNRGHPTGTLPDREPCCIRG